jgi:hypothetical protein
MFARIAILGLALCAAQPAFAKPGLTPDEVAAAFTDDEITDGFMRTVFGAEGKSDKADVSHVHKFTGPVKVYIVSTAMEDRRPQIQRFIRILGRTVQNLSIRVVKRREDANMVVHLMNRSDYRKVIRESLPSDFDTRFLESNHCSAVTGGKRNGVLERAQVFIAASEGRQQVRHCMVEEIVQSLGPVNDDYNLPYSIFNDYSGVQGFGIFDWFILSALYDPRIKPGMSAAEVRPILPKAIADARKRLKGLVAANVIETGSRKPK